MNVTTRAFKCAGRRPEKQPELKSTKAMVNAAYYVWHVRYYGFPPQDHSMESHIRRDAEEARAAK